MIHLLGKPSETVLNKIKDKRIKNFLEDCGKNHSENVIDKEFEGTDTDAIDLLKKLLVFEPE